MEPHKPPPPSRQSEGCLTVAIRVPLRIVVLVLVVPVRMVWDALVAAGRLVRDTVLRPLGRALLWLGKALFVWPFVGLWRYVLVPVGKALAWLGTVLVLVPAGWLHRYVLAPVGHAVAWLAHGAGAGLAWVYARVLRPIGRAVGRAVVWLLRCLFVVPARWLYTWILAPVGRALAWCARGLGRLLERTATGIGLALYWTLRVLLVLPALALWRWVLAPVGRLLAVVVHEVGDALGHAWRIAGRISRAVGRALGTLFRWIFVEPVRWVYRSVLTPVGHAVRAAVLRPVAQGARVIGLAVREALAGARDSVRQARADVRRMLFGEPARPAAVDRREPQGPAARTLGSSTTALTKD
ncbi:hypothetical protein [Streptomyces alanosinicus]|uniref:Uncharacterized protein n=1 Tax=Streptomyces alanosinicus TaxID=68171 RepID=A0A918YDE7_9ACTN|nr:hypothetical protein [Streptomyces alanosinicus]GHD98852.1 hypothetical protein GCM10010339_07680 [Streptomyces alanosinicus]